MFGNRENYDNWNAMGNPGWSNEDVLPYFSKSESFKIPEYKNYPHHGKNRYLTVGHFQHNTEMAQAFLEAGENGLFSIQCEWCSTDRIHANT